MTDIRYLERNSIRSFIVSSAKYLSGDVLDYGCGAQPYEALVPGRYHSWDDPHHPAFVAGGEITEDNPFERGWDAILCTQVIEYVPEPFDLLQGLHGMLVTGGHLVITYPTNWPEVEDADLHRFTKTGMERLLRLSGFELLRHTRRAEVRVGNDMLALGYGAVARKPAVVEQPLLP